MIICVTGTPGTGKTELAKLIAERLNCKYVDANKIIDLYGLKEEYDSKRDTYVVDEFKLAKILESIAEKEKNAVIDSHMSHYMSPEKVDWCIVAKCNPNELRKRLQTRGYSPEKIEENIESEIMDICRNEAEEMGHRIIVVDTTGKKAEELAQLF